MPSRFAGAAGDDDQPTIAACSGLPHAKPAERPAGPGAEPELFLIEACAAGPPHVLPQLEEHRIKDAHHGATAMAMRP